MQNNIIIAATTNEHKIIEISAITEKFGFTVVSRAAAGVPDFEIEENGTTFKENSFIKAKVIMDYTGKPTISDDSGLIVDALDGAPGVYSARYAIKEADILDFENAEKNPAIRSPQDKANNEKLLRMLKDVPFEKRTARFVSVITLLSPSNEPIICRGEVEGHVAFEQTGDNGFGYDPMFIPLGFDETFGTIPSDIKNKISHRYNALVKLKEKLSTEGLTL